MTDHHYELNADHRSLLFYRTLFFESCIFGYYTIFIIVSG
jgi:hypothetical protein